MASAARPVLDRATVAVVGAGPAGAAAAIGLRRLGVPDVALVDARGVPRDKACGGGPSPASIEVLRGEVGALASSDFSGACLRALLRMRALDRAPRVMARLMGGRSARVEKEAA